MFSTLPLLLYRLTLLSVPTAHLRSIGNLPFSTQSKHPQILSNLLYILFSACTTMPADILTNLPVELLTSIIRPLDPLSILLCRQVHSNCKSCVDSLPEYKAYRTKVRDIVQQYRGDRGAKPHRWKLESAARLFDVVRWGVEVDYYLFVQLFLSYPKAMSYVSVLRM